MNELTLEYVVEYAAKTTDIQRSGDGFLRALPTGECVWYDNYGRVEVNESDEPMTSLTYEEMRNAIVLEFA